MTQYIAQKITINDNVIQGPLKNINTLADLINTIVQFIYPFAGILLFVYLVWGGYDYLLSRGNPDKVKAGQGKITSAMVGFILLFLSYILVKIIALVFGFKDGVI